MEVQNIKAKFNDCTWPARFRFGKNEANGIVLCIMEWHGEVTSGVSLCKVGDSFDVEFGKSVAYKRAIKAMFDSVWAFNPDYPVFLQAWRKARWLAEHPRIASLIKHGYPTLSVGDLIDLAGVSDDHSALD